MFEDQKKCILNVGNSFVFVYVCKNPLTESYLIYLGITMFFAHLLWKYHSFSFEYLIP